MPMNASTASILLFFSFLGAVHASIAIWYEYTLYDVDERYEQPVTVTEACQGLRSTTQCCGKVKDLDYTSKDNKGLERVSAQTTRVRPRFLAFLCMFMTHDASGRFDWLPDYDGPYMIRCQVGQIARVKEVKVSGANNMRSSEALVIMVGHCVDRELKRSHTVLGGTIECLDVPWIFPEDTDNVIYAWFTNDAGSMQSTQWSEIRQTNNDSTQSAFSLKKWNRMALAHGPLLSEMETSMEYEVCIFADNNVDTAINIRIGEEGEENEYWFD